LIGFFEGIDSERGIAWPMADPLTPIAPPGQDRRYYAKWTPERQNRQDLLIRKIHDTNLSHTEEQAVKY
jgi:hypothetical protein